MIPIPRAKEIHQQAEHRSFLAQHLHQPVEALLLRYAADPVKRWLLEQIAGHQSLRKKLPHWYGNFDLLLPPRLHLEQSSSRATAQYKARLAPAGARFADLTGGLGADFEAIAPSYEHSLFNEPKARLAELSSHNLKVLGRRPNVKCQPAERLLQTLPYQDFIFLDPSRRNDSRRVFDLSLYEPKVLDLQEILLKRSRSLLIKLSPMVSIAQLHQQWTSPMDIHVLAIRNEVKELLIATPGNQGHSSPKIYTWNLLAGGQAETFDCEQETPRPDLSLQEPQAFIYEPNAALLKAGLGDMLAAKLELQKLDHQSHFYTSDQHLPQYPGKIFQLKHIHKPFASHLKGRRFNVISRHFPLSAQQIEKRMKWKSAEDAFVIATTAARKKIWMEAIWLNHPSKTQLSRR